MYTAEKARIGALFASVQRRIVMRLAVLLELELRPAMGLPLQGAYFCLFGHEARAGALGRVVP